MRSIYSSKKITGSVDIYEEKGIVFYKEQSLFLKKIHQIPIERLGKSISFSRVYHAPFFIAPAYLGFLSLRLIFKKWSVGDWTLYLGLIVFSGILLGLIYYLLAGRHYGEVELDFGDKKLPLFIKKTAFLELQERLSNLNP